MILNEKHTVLIESIKNNLDLLVNLPKEEHDSVLERIRNNLSRMSKAIHIYQELNQCEVHPQVRYLLDIPQYEQRSDEWFKQRKDRLTSSDVDAVLGNSKYSSYDEILFKKCGISKPFTGNEATKHGQQYEDEAIDLYCKRYNKKTFSFGLLPHPTVPFLAGSPDDITYDGIVIEVKCPLRRKIVMGQVPKHYQAQIFMNMEICNLDKAVFIEYKPKTEENDMILNVVHFDRDPNWFSSIFPTLESFWKDVNHYRGRIEEHPKYDYFLEQSKPVLQRKISKGVVCESNPNGFMEFVEYEQKS